MTGPNEPGNLSLWLCHRLNELLDKKIDRLYCRAWKNWCSFQGKGKVFAWVKYSKSGDSIDVYFLGDSSLAESCGVPAKKLSPAKTGTARWKGFGGRFRVEEESELNDVAKFLLRVSYPASL